VADVTTDGHAPGDPAQAYRYGLVALPPAEWWETVPVRTMLVCSECGRPVSLDGQVATHTA
jgi:hypothetical protein